MPVKVVSQTLSPHHLRLIEVRPTVDLSFGRDRFSADARHGRRYHKPWAERRQKARAAAGRLHPGAAYAGLDCPIVVNHYTMTPAMLGEVELPEQTVGSNFVPPGTVGVHRLRDPDQLQPGGR